MACPMSGFWPVDIFQQTFDFFWGGGAGEFFMCYFNLVLTEITCPGHL